MTSEDRLRTASRLRRAGQIDEALQVLQQIAADPGVDPAQAEGAGRQLVRCLDASDRPRIHVRLLGQCTTTWLLPALTLAAWRDGVALRVTEGEYDNVVQEVMGPLPPQGDPDVWVLVPWISRLVGTPSLDLADRIAAELDTWRIAWDRIASQSAGRLIQVGYDAAHPGAAGYLLGARGAGPVAAARTMDRRMGQALDPSAVLVDLARIAGDFGRRRFYSPRRYHWTKQPFSEAGTAELCRHLWAAVRALWDGPRKVLVLDLDNTLWGGVVGEEGPLGIELGESPDGEAFVAFQQYCRELADRGILLAVASKNNPDDALQPFEVNPHMVLAASDLAAFEANWGPKDASLRRMAATLNLGLEHFVFFDDNPAEREQVRQALPMVAVVDVPADPADYVAALSESLWFEAARITDDDRARSARYHAEQARRTVRVEASNLESYLESLQMQGEVRDLDDADYPRAVQLLGKTNQFNLTTRRHSLSEVRGMLAAGGRGWTLRLRDRFGDYGLVGLVLAVPEGRALRLDTVLMSCRVIGRTAEHFLLAQILNHIGDLDLDCIVGEYIPTQKNAMVADLFPSLGFGVDPDEGPIQRFRLPLPARPPATAVRSA